MNLARRALTVGVKKHREGASAEAFRKFGSKLVAGDDFDVPASKRLGKQTAGVPTKSVVTAKRVAVANDNGSGEWRVASG